MGCALLCLNEEKQLSHTPPLITKIKKTSKIIETPHPRTPHIKKQQHCGCQEQKRREVGAARMMWTRPLWSSTDRRRRREVAVKVVSAVGSHCVIFIFVCDWRTSKGLARSEGRGEERMYGERRGEESKGITRRGRSWMALFCRA